MTMIWYDIFRHEHLFSTTMLDLHGLNVKYHVLLYYILINTSDCKVDEMFNPPAHFDKEEKEW